MVNTEENKFFEKLSDKEIDNLIGELCSVRDNNPDVKVIDNIKNNINPVLQEQIDITNDAIIVEEDILTSILKSEMPLTHEEIDVLKANNLYNKYISKFNNSQEDNMMIEEEIKRNLALSEDDAIETVIESEETKEESFPETKYTEESSTSNKDNNTNEDKKSSKEVLDSYTSNIAYETLDNVSKEIAGVVNTVTSVKDLSESINEAKKENIAKTVSEFNNKTDDDDHEMSIEEINDVPATNLSVDDKVLTSVLTDKYNTVSDEDAIKLIEVINRYKSGEKFDVFESLPKSLKDVIYKEAMSVGADKSLINFFAKSFINDLVDNTYLDKEITDFNQELKEVLAPMGNIAGTVMDEYSDEVYHKFTDKLEKKADEIQEDNPKKAEQLRVISKSFKEAVSLERIIGLLKFIPSSANKAYKMARDNWNKFCSDYDNKISTIKPAPRDIEHCIAGLNNTELKYQYDESIIKALVVMVANSVIDAIDEGSLNEHIYAYYSSNALYTIMFTANNSEVNAIIMNSVKEALDLIKNYMEPLLARNSKKDRKRNRKK